LSQLGILPTEAVFIDDDAENVAAAVALGINVIRFSSTAHAIAALEGFLSDGT
jgi:FMN phosphatase YigB (HAD superfamily)